MATIVGDPGLSDMPFPEEGEGGREGGPEGDLRALFVNSGVPPAKLRVFAPSGCKPIEVTGWVGMKTNESGRGKDLYLVEDRVSGEERKLNKTVVILNVHLNRVVYNPRCMLLVHDPLGVPLLTLREVAWLDWHPEWPNILELDDRPVENGEDNEGLYATP